jgi:hypothetical protein
MRPGRKKQAKINSAAQARNARLEKLKKPNSDKKVDENDMSDAVSVNSDTDEGDWNGTVNYYPSDDSEFCWTDTESDDSDSDSVDELDGEDLYTSIDSELARELEDLAKETAYEIILNSGKEVTNKIWRKLDAKLRTGVHIGNASRSLQHHAKEARDKAVADAVLRKT